jgi:excisionase family DNA binding protein
MDLVDRLLTVKEVADYLAVPPATIYGWRHRGVGPLGFRVGRHVRFRWADVERWVETQRTASKSGDLFGVRVHESSSRERSTRISVLGYASLQNAAR